MRVNESAYAIGEQHIHFLWLYDRGYLTFTKHGMRERLSFAIRSSPIIRRAELGRRTSCCAGPIRNSRVAHRTTNARDLSCLTERNYNVTSLLITCEAHLVDTISNFENWLLVHVFLPFPADA